MPRGIFPHKKGARRPLSERFWGKVDKSGVCWIWKGSKDKNGYGHIKIDGKIELAHRVAYKLAVNPSLPDEVDVCHSCDTPFCCRPEHLFEGSSLINMRDAASKGRLRSWRQKLSPSKVTEIRQSKDIPQNALALQYGVTEGTISSVISVRTWKHVIC